MTGRPKPKPRPAFDDNIADAETLLRLAKSLRNQHVRRMRQELRDSIGEALHIPRNARARMDRVRGADFFAVLLPGSNLSGEDFGEASLRPLLRQALVAACAAVETFVADRVMERIGSTLRWDSVPERLRELSMTVGDWLDIESKYERRQWGVRSIVEKQVNQMSSPAPSQIGQVFSLVGEQRLWRRVDHRRGVTTGESQAELERIYERRNRIAHTGDRVGRGRAVITVEEVEADLACLISIVGALDKETQP